MEATELRVLLICGAGMSSGFLAQKTRKAAKKAEIKITIEARSESDVEQYLGKVNMVLIGPHYKRVLNEVKDLYGPYNTPVALIPQEIYGGLDGEGLLKLIMNKLKNE